MPEPQVHHLSDKNFDELTATCSVCGPTGIRANGGGFVCLESRRATRRAAKQKKPKQVSTPSPHKLTNVSGDRATCAIDGDVAAVPWGRGWMCEARFKELGWTSQQKAPQKRCPICNHWLDRLEVCLYCTNARGDDIHGLLLLERTIDYDAEKSVTPTLPVLGSTAPATATFTVRPEYAALFGGGRG